MGRRRRSNTDLPARMYLKHGAYWHVANGTWTRLGKSLSEALEGYAKLYEAPQGSMPWLIDQAMPHINRGCKPRTVAQYAIAAKKLKRYLRDFSPEQVLPKHVARIKMQYADTPNMTNRVISVLRMVFAYAVEQQYVDSNPVIGIKRHEEQKRKRLITPEQYAAIYTQAGPRLQVIMDLLRLTGQRIQDVLTLRRDALLEEGIRFVQMKEGAKLVVKWTPALRQAVERAKGLSKVPAVTLLRNRMGRPPDYSTVHLQWQKACKAAGVEDATPHDLRAFALTQAKKEGKDPTALAGHATAQTTVRYLRAKEEPLVSGPEY